MPFELIDDLHPDLNPLMWLVGNWHGNGRCAFPGVEEYTFEEDVVFHHDGRPFLHYMSQTWATGEDGERLHPAGVETGFLLPKGESSIELLLSTHTGYGEALAGTVDGPRLEFLTSWQARPEGDEEYTEQRMYGLVDSDLMYATDRQTALAPMQSFAWGRLRRV